MNATTTATYNPFRAAFAELTSPRAQQYYAHRAQADIQTTLEEALTVYCVAVGVAQLLVDFYTEYNALALPTVTETIGLIEDELPLLKAPAIPASEHPRFENGTVAAPVSQAELNQCWMLGQIRPVLESLETSTKPPKATGQKRGRKPLDPKTTLAKPCRNYTKRGNSPGKQLAVE